MSELISQIRVFRNKRYELIGILQHSELAMYILRSVKLIDSEELWVAGGFIRNLIWNQKHKYPLNRYQNDVDVFYFNKEDFSAANDFSIEEQLKKSRSGN